MVARRAALLDGDVGYDELHAALEGKLAEAGGDHEVRALANGMARHLAGTVDDADAEERAV